MSTCATHPPVTRLLTARDVQWDLEPAVWPSPPARLVPVAKEILSLVGDELARRTIARLSIALLDAEAETRALRETLAAATARTHRQHLEARRQAEIIAQLREARRAGA
jgi:hypothetical protein